MTFPRARLVVSALLFVGWIVFLLFLAVRSPSVIVARPQFLVSSLYVEAKIEDERGHPRPRVTIVKVLWPAEAVHRDLRGKDVEIPELFFCGKEQGYQGAGTYVLPLTRLVNPGEGEFTITPLPRFAAFAEPNKDKKKKRFAAVEVQRVPITDEVVGGAMTALAGPVEAGPCWQSSVLLAGLKTAEQRIFRCLVSDAGKSKEDAAALVELLFHQKVTHITAARGLPLDDALQLEKALQDAGAKTHRTEVELRIYPATPSVVAQVDEIIASKK